MNWTTGYTLAATLAVLLAVLCVWCWRGGDRVRDRRRCPKCWYDLAGVATLRCPECGTTAKSERELFRVMRRMRWAWAAVLFVVAASGCGVAAAVQQRDWRTYIPTTALILMYPHVELPPASDPLLNWPIEFRLSTMNRRGSTWAWQRRWIARRAGTAMNPEHPIDQRLAALMLLSSCGAEGLSELDRVFALTSDPDPRVRHGANQPLAVLSAYSDEAWVYVKEMLRPDALDEGTLAAIDWLPVNKLPRGEIMSLLIGLLGSDERRVVFIAHWYLQFMDPPALEALPALEGARDRWRDEDPGMTFDRLIAMIRDGSPGDLDFRLQVIEGQICDERVETPAQQVGVWCGVVYPEADSARYLPRMIRLLRDAQSEEVRNAMVQYLSAQSDVPQWAREQLNELHRAEPPRSPGAMAMQDVISHWARR